MGVWLIRFNDPGLALPSPQARDGVEPKQRDLKPPTQCHRDGGKTLHPRALRLR